MRLGAALAALLFASAAFARPRPGGPMKDETTYPAEHAGPHRAGAIKAVTAARGEVAWSVAIKPNEARVPFTLLLWRGRPVLSGYRSFALHGADGGRLWQKQKRPGGPVCASGQRLWFQEPDGDLGASDIEGNAVEHEVPIPGLSNDEFVLTLLYPRENDFVTASSWRGQEPNAREKDRPGPQVLGRRTRYGDILGDWSANWDGEQSLPALYLPGLHRLVVGVGAFAIVADVERPSGDADAIRRFALPELQPVEWSAGPDGTLYLLGTAGGRLLLVALSPEGKELWRWTEPAGEERWAGLPPLVTSSGRLYALTEGRVLAFDGGALTWERDVRSRALRHGAHQDEGSFQVSPEGKLIALARVKSATALGDGSILVAVSKTLRHYDRAGRELFAVAVEEEIESAPVVDGEGNIFLATAGRLVQIR